MWRQIRQKLPLFFAVGLTGCIGSGLDEGQIGFIEGFFGGIIADEPRAALIGRDVLSAGGSAADAAVAAYFTMAVTMPGAASLGGGGICMVFDRETNRIEAIEFLARVPATGDRSATVAVPGNMRGMALMQARYGRLNWSDLLIPAENFARDGHAISRAFARDLQKAAPTLRGDAEARRIFGLDGGEITEGKIVRQLELAALLTLVRTRGAGEFYTGNLGRQFVEGVRNTGASMTTTDLREYRPTLQEPLQFDLGDEKVYFPPPPADGGVMAAQLWTAGRDDDRYDDGSPAQRVHLLSEIAARAYAQQQDPVARTRSGESATGPGAIETLVANIDSNRHQAGEGPGSPVTDFSARGRHDGASIVAADSRGQAVACSFSLNRPFGADKMAPGTGILLAAPEAGSRASLPSALLVANPISYQVFFGAAISGGSPALLADIALDTYEGEGDFGVAITKPRAYGTGNPDLLVVEPTLPPAQQSFLEQAGHTLQQQERLGRINGFWCPEGLPRAPVCQFVRDPRAHGLAASADAQ